MGREGASSWSARIALGLVPGAVTGMLFILRSSWASGGRRHFTLFDDAMISMSYARTLARSGELVWFEGAARVEGFTNPLWTLIMAALHAAGLGPSQVALGIMLIGWVCILVAAASGARLSLRLRPSALWAPPVIAFTISMTYPLIFWSLRGLEVGLIVALTMATLMGAIAWSDPSVEPSRRRGFLVLTCGMMIVGLATRLDFAVIAVAVGGWMLWQASPGAERLRTALLLGGSLLGVLAALTAARFAYYGEVVPNTYWLKLSGVPLWERLERGLFTALKLVPPLALTATGGALLWRVSDAMQRRWLLLLLATGLSVIAYSVGVGGDAWEYVPNRYVAPFLACAAVVGITGVEARARERRRKWGGLAWAFSMLALLALGLAVIDVGWAWRLAVFTPATAVAALWLLLSGSGTERLTPFGATALAAIAMLLSTSGIGYLSWALLGGQYVEADKQMAEEGRALGAMTAPEAVIAVVWAGGPVYYSERPAVDLLGKSDRRVASAPSRGGFRPGHDRWDYSYSILGLRPDIIHQLWEVTSEDWRAIREAGYEAYCLGLPRARAKILVRSDSELVDRSALERC